MLYKLVATLQSVDEIVKCDHIHTNETLGRIQDLTKGGSDKRPPKAVAPRGVRGYAPPEKF